MAGHPLPGGEGEAGGVPVGYIVSTTTDGEAIHGVVRPCLGERGKLTAVIRGRVEHFHTRPCLIIRSTRHYDSLDICSDVHDGEDKKQKKAEIHARIVFLFIYSYSLHRKGQIRIFIFVQYKK